MKVARLLSIIFALCFMTTAHSQETEYKMELGAMVGGMNYMGDANSKLLKGTNVTAGIIGRYVLNPHMAIKGNLLVGKISGNTASSKEFYPQTNNGATSVSQESASTSFSRSIVDLGAQFEYNFWGFGTGKGYKGTRRLTPYILGGLGFTLAPKSGSGVFTLNIPMGLGMKYKIKERWNAGAEFSFRYTLSDKLDTTPSTGLQLNDPYGIKSSGIKNKDGYTVAMVYITYDLMPKYRKCNN